MKAAFKIINGFVHDFAAGCWGATVLTVYWLHRSTGKPGSEGIIKPLQEQFFWIGLACVLVVLVTGAGRGFTYVPDVYGKESESSRKKLLIVKHLVLLGVFGSGIAWQYMMVFIW